MDYIKFYKHMGLYIYPGFRWDGFDHPTSHRIVKAFPMGKAMCSICGAKTLYNHGIITEGREGIRDTVCPGDIVLLNYSGYLIIFPFKVLGVNFEEVSYEEYQKFLVTRNPNII